MWRTRCAECERYFQTTAFHGHDPKPAPTLCRRYKLAERERAVTVAEMARPSAVAKQARAAEERLAAARLAEQDLAKRERAVAERERAATSAELERRRVEAKVSAEREHGRPFQGCNAGRLHGLVGLQARRICAHPHQIFKLPV